MQTTIKNKEVINLILENVDKSTIRDFVTCHCPYGLRQELRSMNQEHEYFTDWVENEDYSKVLSAYGELVFQDQPSHDKENTTGTLIA